MVYVWITFIFFQILSITKFEGGSGSENKGVIGRLGRFVEIVGCKWFQTMANEKNEFKFLHLSLYMERKWSSFE